MKPAAFEYVRAASVDEAVAALARNGADAKILAGGQSLVPMLNFRLVRPSVLVDINRVPGLAFVRASGDGLRVGALTRHHALETSPAVREHFPVLSDAMTHVAHLAIRNRGTIGGSLAHADPAAELPLLAVLLDATVETASPAGARTIAAQDFFVAALTSALAEAEVVTEVFFPALPPATGWGFEEFARRSGDFALVAAAALVRCSGNKVVAARVAVTGVGDVPLRVPTAESALVGRALEPDVVDAAARAAGDAVQPHNDLHASADYRRHLVVALTRRVVLAAGRRARGESA